MKSLQERFRSTRRDGGFSLPELIVAIGLFGILTTIAAQFLIQGHGVARNLVAKEDSEQSFSQWNEDFQWSFSRALAIRDVSVAGATTATRRNLSFDFYDPNGKCLRYEIKYLVGKPTTSFATDVQYFTYRKGQLATSGNVATCTSSAPNVIWGVTRWQVDPPDFIFYDTDGADITTTMPTASSVDNAAYANILTLEYRRTASKAGDTTYVRKISKPASLLNPSY